MSGPTTVPERHTGAAAAVHDAPAIATRESSSSIETRGGRRRRKARRGGMYLRAIISVALLVCVVALALDNTGRVRLHWLVGSGSASLIWIVLLAAVLGWLLGLATASVFRWRTRAPHAGGVRS
jgi:uncharacterized integral membrane protein